MKKKLMFVLGLSILLTGWLVLEYAFGIEASEPASLKTVTLRIEGMT